MAPHTLFTHATTHFISNIDRLSQVSASKMRITSLALFASAVSTTLGASCKAGGIYCGHRLLEHSKSTECFFTDVHLTMNRFRVLCYNTESAGRCGSASQCPYHQ